MADDIKNKDEKLVNAMQRLKATNSKEDLEKFEECLLDNAAFYVPVRIADNGRERRIAFGVVKDQEKHHYYSVFTSLDALRAAKGKGSQYTTATFETLGRTAMGDARISGFVINAGTDNMIVGRKLISDVMLMYQAKDNRLSVIEADKDVELTAPTGDYAELVDALKDWLRQDPNISAAYLRQMTRNGVDIWVIVVSHIHKTEPSFGNIITVARDFAGGHEVAVLSARSKAGEKAIKDILPFYRKPFTIVEDNRPMD